MTYFCTYCSARKDKREGLLPAIERYKDERINHIYDGAMAIGVGFLILSGEYGLIRSKDKIPYYDHRLMAEEVEAIARKMVIQLKRLHATQIVYFTESLEKDRQVGPYLRAIQIACDRASVALSVFNI